VDSLRATPGLTKYIQFKGSLVVQATSWPTCSESCMIVLGKVGSCKQGPEYPDQVLDHQTHAHGRGKGLICMQKPAGQHWWLRVQRETKNQTDLSMLHGRFWGSRGKITHSFVPEPTNHRERMLPRLQIFPRWLLRLIYKGVLGAELFFVTTRHENVACRLCHLRKSSRAIFVCILRTKGSADVGNAVQLPVGDVRRRCVDSKAQTCDQKIES
jgi:hypothetical protein